MYFVFDQLPSFRAGIGFFTLGMKPWFLVGICVRYPAWKHTHHTATHTKNVSSPELQERLRRPANHSLARVCRALSQTRPPSLMIIDERGGAWRSWMRELLTSQITKAFVPSLYKRLGQQWPNWRTPACSIPRTRATRLWTTARCIGFRISSAAPFGSAACSSSVATSPSVTNTIYRWSNRCKRNVVGAAMAFR